MSYHFHFIVISLSSPMFNNKRNSTIDQQYWRVLLERTQGRLVEDSIMECASAYFCHDCLVSPLTCTRDGARTRSQDGENDMSEEPFQCGICDELCKGTKYAHSSTLVLSDSHGPSIPRHAHHWLIESLAQILGSPCFRWYFERQRRRRHINARARLTPRPQ